MGSILNLQFYNIPRIPFKSYLYMDMKNYIRENEHQFKVFLKKSFKI